MSAMTSRERVIAAIEFRGPDRIPIRHCELPASYRALPGLLALYRQYPSDFAGENADCIPPLPQAYTQGNYTDEWGCTWTVALPGYMGQVTGHPLADLAQLAGYRVPGAANIQAQVNGARAVAGARGDRYLCVGWLTVFERMDVPRGRTIRDRELPNPPGELSPPPAVPLRRRIAFGRLAAGKRRVFQRQFIKTTIYMLHGAT